MHVCVCVLQRNPYEQYWLGNLVYIVVVMFVKACSWRPLVFIKCDSTCTLSKLLSVYMYMYIVHVQCHMQEAWLHNVS